MPIPMDLSSTDDHGHHLRNETARRTITLRLRETPVKNDGHGRGYPFTRVGTFWSV